MRYTHGMSTLPEYLAWRNMRERTSNPNNPGYASYGGRGIRVCDRWARSFESFLADVGRRPGKGYSIDRINNDGNYEPGNVRWATRFQQQHNLRSNVFLTHEGETLCAYEWSRRLGIPKNTILRRVAAGLATADVLKPAEHRPERLRGVYFAKRTGRWQAIVQRNGERHHLGTFDTDTEAADAVAKFLASIGIVVPEPDEYRERDEAKGCLPVKSKVIEQKPQGQKALV